MKEQVVVITGAAGGIGRAIAEQFVATYGSDALYITLLDHTKAYVQLKELHRELHDLFPLSTRNVNCEIKTWDLDVTDLAAVSDGLQSIASDCGGISVLVNAAGIMPKDAMQTLAKVTEQNFLSMRRVMDVNFWGTLHCCHAVLPYMRRAGYGRIVNIASVEGLKGDVGNLAYAASKAAVLSLTKTLACEAPFNKNRDEPALDITVNAVAPGIVETPMTTDLSDAALASYLARNPQRRKIQPAEIAQTVLWLASKEASAINGACLPVDGGYLVS
ncbi:SDR family oxidoreductase [Candidatus Kaiserbacteria bacterium]|nr:SDR family oxidoreductase [Candidatus Kaiserbacteria bacterium]